MLLNIWWARRDLRAARARRRGAALPIRQERRMTPRQRRMTLVPASSCGVGIAGALALQAFRENVMFYFDPTQGGGRRRSSRASASGWAAWW